MVNYIVPPIKKCRHYFFVLILILCLAGAIKCANSNTDEDYSSLEEFEDDKPLDKFCSKNETLLFLQPRSNKSPNRPSPKSSCLQRDLPYGVDEKQFGELVKNLTAKNQMDAYDLRDDPDIANYNCTSLKEISNQGGCQSCWAVVATDVMTDRLCIQSKGMHTTRYSAVDLLTCCSYCKMGGNKGDACKSAGMHRLAWRYWVQVGLVSGHYNNENRAGKSLKTGCRDYTLSPCSHTQKDAEKCSVESMQCPFPKKGEEPSCLKKREPGCENMKGKICYSLDRQFDGNETAIKVEIMRNGPVHAFVTPYQSFYEMFSDKAKKPKDVEPYLGPKDEKNDTKCGSHSVRIVGWGKNKTSGRSYWIAANSWGKHWGDNGFFHLDFDHDKPIKLDNGEIQDKGDARVFGGIPEFK